MRLAERIRAVFALDPQAWAIEFEGRQCTWGELAGFADQIGAAIRVAGAGDNAAVGWAAQNTPSAVAALAATMLHEHCACVLNPHLPAKVLTQDVAIQKFPVIVGDAQFWDVPGVKEAAKAAGSAGLTLEWRGGESEVAFLPGLEHVGPGSHRAAMPGYAIERTSSGTTGPPKRLPETEAALLHTLAHANRRASGPDEALVLKRSPSIVFKALAHGAGSFGVTLALYEARPVSLHQRFTVDATIDAFHRHKAKVGQFVPTMIKMIWDADVPPEKLSSLVAIRSGTAPLDPDLQDKFEEKYGIPILIDYGATELGSVAAWTLEHHKRFAKQKRGSVGRATPGVQLRVVTQAEGDVITDGKTIGLLEVKSAQTPNEWVRTNDLAILDPDGFLYIRGRADDAIVRGGFKVLPEEIRAALLKHPDVADAVVVGVPDERLGQVPVAVIEGRPGRAPPSPDDLKTFAKEHLTAYQAPVAYKIVDQIPRSASMKAITPEIMKIAMS